MNSVEGVIQYSVEEMSSEVWMLVSVWIFAEHGDLVSVALILEEMTVSLFSAVVVVLVHLVLAA